MNLIATTRHILNMTQPAFGCWLGYRVGTGKPISPQHICDYEKGRRSPSLPVRAICEPIVARVVVREILDIVVPGCPVSDTQVEQMSFKIINSLR